MCQFSGLETITSAIIDLFPGQMRRPWRREIFLVIFCSMLFLVQILFITEVFGLSGHNPMLGWAVLNVWNFKSDLTFKLWVCQTTIPTSASKAGWINSSSTGIPMALFCDSQGGVYLFQLVDYYAANGTCIMFGSIIHCLAVGWAFGKWYNLLWPSCHKLFRWKNVKVQRSMTVCTSCDGDPWLSNHYH